MGKDFFDEVAVCRETYGEASEAVGWDVAAMCFGEDDRLNLTEYTQPCILTTEIAMMRGLKTLYGFSPSFFGGHSLGEFTALVAAAALPLSEAVIIVQNRGRLMQRATPVGVGAMAAVIAEGLDKDVLEKTIGDLPMDIANINSPKQIVISGSADAMAEAEARIMKTFADKAGLRFVRLNVSAPFHSRFMRTIEGPFTEVLREKGKGLDPSKAVSVTSNYTGTFHTGQYEDLIRSLTAQLGHSVRWKDNMAAVAGVTASIYEVGPGRPLREFFKTINVECQSVISLSTAQRIWEGKG
jgi:[acyl-carrier-protein] S-malonyltransferase/trans-AT polyketide synthase/acyltransferase/oxidoreductase domain-containing protein